MTSELTETMERVAAAFGVTRRRVRVGFGDAGENEGGLFWSVSVFVPQKGKTRDREVWGSGSTLAEAEADACRSAVSQ